MSRHPERSEGSHLTSLRPSTMRIVRLFILASAVLWTACKNEPRYAAGTETATHDPSRLCVDGGATLDVDTNTCICPHDSSWNGIRCAEIPKTATETPAPGPSLPAGLPPQGGEAEAPTHVESAEPEPPVAQP